MNSELSTKHCKHLTRSTLERVKYGLKPRFNGCDLMNVLMSCTRMSADTLENSAGFGHNIAHDITGRFNLVN